MDNDKSNFKAEKYDPVALEPSILKFWEKDEIYKKAKEKNAGRKRFYFLDGPPYTSGKIHLGTAWNKPLKDMVLRYKRMNGFDVWDRAGYDMHGLPTEHATEKKLGLNGKEDIIKYGVDKFITECKKLCVDNLQIMNKDFIRLGVWMDFENAYQSITNGFIDGEWWLIKKAHENNRLYRGLRTMTWCKDCATALAKHELDYEEVTDNSIFVKFKVKDKENEYFIVWTTTPWTIPFNMAIMVNPELEYVKVKVDNEVWILSKQLGPMVMQAVVGKKYEEIECFLGDKLEGIKYEHFFEHEMHYSKLHAKNPQKVHSVVLSTEYVDTSAGTGLVHCAPGCGPEDYEVGYKNGIPPFNTLDDNGIFPKSTGKFAGLIARKDDAKFIKFIEDAKALIATSEVQHDYAHCWRCHNGVIYRTTKQWFFKVEDMKDELIKENNKIKWIPTSAYNAFNSWLENLRDNSISKQRFWGTPLPIWMNEKDENDYIVIGSIKELEELSGLKIEDLHVPKIDEIKITKDGKIYRRVPDILDVWVDAGTVSWNCLDFPNRKDLFEEMYPADFILEGKDQIRGWYNLLHVASMVSMNRPAFKTVYMHGFVNDALGRKMSKSLGNVISPYEVIDKYGADTFRYYAIGGANPGFDLNYNFDDLKVKRRNLEVLWNIHNFLIDYSKQVDLPTKEEAKDAFSFEEKYILSKLNSTIKKVTELYESYQLNQIPWEIESLFLELSRTYMQLVRDKSSIGEEIEKKSVMWTIYTVLMETLKMFATIAPFVSESIYQDMKKYFDLSEDSIHHCKWPHAQIDLIDLQLESDMQTAQQIIQSILSAREKAKLGVRWPLKEVVIESNSKDVENTIKNLGDIIKTQCNIREIKIVKLFDQVEKSIKVDFPKLGPLFTVDSPKVIAKLTQESSASILSKLEKEGKYTFKLDGKVYEVPSQVFKIERVVKEPYIESQTKGGYLYLNSQMTKDLEEEGFARELMRRIQSMRKTAGLNKTQRIELYITANNSDLNIFSVWKLQIMEKVGASNFEFGTDNPKQEYTNTESVTVKDKEFKLFFNIL